MSEENIRRVLRDFGATEKETEIYIFLAKHGILKGGEIVKATKTHKALVYRILDNLRRKGLVEATLESPARFTAVPFETVLDLSIKAKRDEAAQLEQTRKEILTYWKNISQPQLVTSEKFVVIEGNRRIYPKISQMIKETKNQLSAVTTIPGLLRADRFGLLDVSSEHPSKSKIRFRFLTNLSNQDVGAAKKLLKEMSSEKIRFEGRTPNLGLNVFPRMVIKDEEEVMFFITSNGELSTTEQDNASLWTNSKALVQAFTAMFEDLWHNSTDICKKIDEIETGKLTPKTYVISDEQTAQKKYEEVMNSAEKEILVMTSSKGLIRMGRNLLLLKEWIKKGVLVKIMAPILSENLDVAKRLSEYSAVKHVPEGYLATAIIDGEHLFQFKTPPPEQEKLDDSAYFENMFYSDDLEYVEKTRTMLEAIWKNASIPSAATLEVLLSSPSPTLTGAQYTEASKISGRKITTMCCNLAVEAIIHPFSQLKLSGLVIDVFKVEEKATFGAGVVMIVALRDESPPSYSTVPVAIVETNPHPTTALFNKSIFAGTPAAQNVMIVKPDELELCKRGNTFFAGWTVPISLPPTPHILPPSCILLEEHGNPKHISRAYDLPSGYKLIAEWDVRDAFLTFMSPSLNYAGPATEGMVGKHVTTVHAP